MVNLFKQFKGLNFYPIYNCGFLDWFFYNLQYQVAYAGITMNTATLTRFNINCEKKSKFFNEPMKVDYLYMMPKNNKILPPPAFQEGIKKHQCIVYHTKEDWLLCAKNKTPEWLKSYLRHIK